MKIKLLGMFLGLVAGGIIIVAQEPNPLPEPTPVETPEPAPAIEPAESTPAEPTPIEPAESTDPVETLEPAVPVEPLPTPVEGEVNPTEPFEVEPTETVDADQEVPIPALPSTVPVPGFPSVATPADTTPVRPVDPNAVESPEDDLNIELPPTGTTETLSVGGIEIPAVSEEPLEPVGAEDAEDEAKEVVKEQEAEIVPLIVIDEVPLTDAIRNLARQSMINFQFDPAITQSTTNQPLVSIRFENVTAEDALDAVLDNYSLELLEDPKTGISRVTIRDPEAPDPLVTQIVQLKYLDPTNTVTLVQSTLSVRSSVAAAPGSKIIVTTTEVEMQSALALIDAMDVAPRQVLIEGHIMETSRSPKSIKGIDWSATFSQQAFTFGNAEGVITEPAVQGDRMGNLLIDTARGFNPSTAFLDANGVAAVLNFLNTDAETEVLSTPRAVTLNNRRAVLSVTRAFPVFNITPGSANSPAGAEVTYTNLGTILEVTPRITANDMVQLRVIPEVSNVDSQEEQILNGFANTANIYAIRRVQAEVMIPSGHTLVMGGLVSDSRTKQYVKVPILGDIPGLGAMFRQKERKQTKANLLVFVTPTIVSDEDFNLNAAGPSFLATKMKGADDEEWGSFDSAKPHDWTKPVE